MKIVSSFEMSGISSLVALCNSPADLSPKITLFKEHPLRYSAAPYSVGLAWNFHQLAVRDIRKATMKETNLFKVP
jgi:hypothetical protein